METARWSHQFFIFLAICPHRCDSRRPTSASSFPSNFLWRPGWSPSLKQRRCDRGKPRKKDILKKNFSVTSDRITQHDWSAKPPHWMEVKWLRITRLSWKSPKSKGHLKILQTQQILEDRSFRQISAQVKRFAYPKRNNKSVDRNGSGIRTVLGRSITIVPFFLCKTVHYLCWSYKNEMRFFDPWKKNRICFLAFYFRIGNKISCVANENRVENFSISWYMIWYVKFCFTLWERGKSQSQYIACGTRPERKNGAPFVECEGGRCGWDVV